MVWNIILWTYIIASTLTFLIGVAVAFVAKKHFKETYRNARLHDTYLIERLLAGLRAILVSFMPVIHFVLLFMLVFQYERMVDYMVAGYVKSIESKTQD